jgi:prevent-host-death family protein
MTQTVNAHEAKIRSSALMAAVEAGERVVIARDGKPAVELVPPPGGGHRPKARRPPGRSGLVGMAIHPAVFAPLGDAEADAEG